MSTGTIVLIVIGVLIVCILGWFVSTSNSINRVKLKIEESLSGVEIQLRQRYDVLMQGKNVAEQYAKHEQKIFETLRSLNQIPNHASVDQLNEASKAQEEAVKGLFALGEAYPELKNSAVTASVSSSAWEGAESTSKARSSWRSTIRSRKKRLLSLRRPQVLRSCTKILKKRTIRQRRS